MDTPSVSALLVIGERLRRGLTHPGDRALARLVMGEVVGVREHADDEGGRDRIDCQPRREPQEVPGRLVELVDTACERRGDARLMTIGQLSGQTSRDRKLVTTRVA